MSRTLALIIGALLLATVAGASCNNQQAEVKPAATVPSSALVDQMAAPLPTPSSTRR